MVNPLPGNDCFANHAHDIVLIHLPEQVNHLLMLTAWDDGGIPESISSRRCFFGSTPKNSTTRICTTSSAITKLRLRRCR